MVIKDARRNGQLTKKSTWQKVNLAKKSTCRKHRPELFGYFMDVLTHWQVGIFGS